MYRWRQLSLVQRKELLEYRKLNRLPWHRPPHRQYDGRVTSIFSAACFEHRSVIGVSPQRMAEFEEELLEVARQGDDKVHAWCILPNHYHLQASSSEINSLRKRIGQLHGRTSLRWNREDDAAGRKVWFNYFDRDMRGQSDFFATINYIHNNPVHHGYTAKWLEWPYSSAHQFLHSLERAEAERIWRDHPIEGYGDGWDDA